MRVKISAMPVRLLGMAIFASFATALAGGLPASALVNITDKNSNYVVPAEGSTENIVVKSGTNATITLDGNLTVTGSHAIAVEEGAVLTIKGAGTVEAIGKEFVPLYNNGTTTIDGGVFYKNAAKGSGYAIHNDRDMVINNATVLMDTGDTGGNITSSLIENGGSADGARNLTIKSGTFTGGATTVKNDGEGILVIDGGTFINHLNTAVYNYHKATINGGVFTVSGAPDDGKHLNAAIYTNAIDPSKYGVGEVAINGGTFNADSLLTTDNYAPMGQLYDIPPVTITSGEFNVQRLISAGYASDNDRFTDTNVTGGTFADDVELPALPEGYFKYDVVDPLTKEAVKIVTDQQVDFESSTITYSMQVGDKYQMDLPELVAKYGVVNNFVGGIDGVDGGAVSVDGTTVAATAAGHATVTISFSGETRTYDFTIAESDTTTPEVTPPVVDDTDEKADIAAPNTGVKFMSIASVVVGGITALLFAGAVAKRAFDNK